MAAGDDDKPEIYYVTSHGQSGGITAGQVHLYAEDKSLKRQIRDLFNVIDSRIPFAIDQGELIFDTRMTTNQFAKLEQLCALQGSANFIAKADVIGRLMHSQINNGTYGPTTAEREQLRLRIILKSAIQQ